MAISSPYDIYNTYKNDVDDDLNKVTSSASQTLDGYTGKTDAAYKQAVDDINQQAADQIKQLDQKYDPIFAKNDLQQRVNERQLAERMQQMGLSHSGLNRTQQTALMLQRSNADQSAARQMNAESAQIRQQAKSAVNALNQQKLQGQADALYDMGKLKQNAFLSLLNAANDRNSSFANTYYSGQQKEADRNLQESSLELDRKKQAATEQKYKDDLRTSLLSLLLSSTPSDQRVGNGAYDGYIQRVINILSNME